MIGKGDVHRYSRTFGEADVDAFADMSGDHGRHHMVADAEGRRIVHGLLVVSVATRVGAEMHYIAHQMQWIFARPVYTGDTVTAELTVMESNREPGRTRLMMSVRIRNQDNKVVVRGETTGVVLDVDA